MKMETKREVFARFENDYYKARIKKGGKKILTKIIDTVKEVTGMGRNVAKCSKDRPCYRLARTSSSAKNQCAPPKAVLDSEPRIHWRKRAKQRGRCFATPTPCLLQNHLVRLWCPRQESNLHHDFRKVASYPLNDEGYTF